MNTKQGKKTKVFILTRKAFLNALFLLVKIFFYYHCFFYNKLVLHSLRKKNNGF